MYSLSKKELDEMANVDICTVDINTLTDLRDIYFNTKHSVERKLSEFAAQTKNVYIHRMGDYIVKVKFQETGPNIDDKMRDYLRYLAEIHL